MPRKYTFQIRQNCRDVTKGTLRRKNKIEFCIGYSRGYSAGHFYAKNWCPQQFLTELLRIASFKTCIMKNSIFYKILCASR